MERLEGVLRIDDGLVADLELVAGKSKHVRKVRAGCHLELPDGTRVSVDAATAQLKGWKPKVACHGSWDELESHPAAAPFGDVAPGPHVRAKLSVQGPGDKSRVVIEGTVSRGSPAGAGESYRANVSSVPVHIEAARIRNAQVASASDSGDEPGGRRPKKADSARAPTSAWTRGWRAMAAIAGGLSVIAIVQAMFLPMTRPAQLGGWSVAGAALLLTASAAVNLRPMPAFVRDQEINDLRGTLIVVWATAGLLPLLGLLCSFSESIPLLISGDAAAVTLNKAGRAVGLRVDYLRWYSMMAYAGVAALAFVQWVVALKSLARSRVLTKSLSAASEFVEGKWVVAEGLVEAAQNPVRECTHKYLGKHRGTSTTCSGKPLSLKTPAGDLEVGAGGIWASTEEAGDQSTTTYRVHSGAHAVVAGRVSRGDHGPALAGKGEESLFLYAAATSPRRELRLRALLAGAQLAMAASAVGLAILLGYAGN